MMDIINPWGALRRANEEIAELEGIIADLCDELDNAEELILQGHFRNPETGRIGPKGETFGG
jgi:hypothetical protein